MLLVMPLAHVGKGSNSRSQMLFKTGALKNLKPLFDKVSRLKACIHI